MRSYRMFHPMSWRQVGSRHRARPCGGYRRRRKAPRCVRMFVTLLASGALTAPPALATPPMSWEAPTPIDDQPPFAYPAEVSGVSCPSTSLCVAVDGVGDVLASSNPTGGTEAWTRTKVTESLNGVSCVSAELCVAVGNQAIATSTKPADGSNAWSTTSVWGDLEAVSCARTRLCVAVDGLGNIWTTTNPTGGVSAWSKAHIGEFDFRGVSCPSTKLCVVVGYEHGDVVTSTDPTGGAGAWTVTNVDSNNTISDVSCPSERLCVATDNAGNVLTSTHPTGDAGEWRSVPVGGGLEHVSCAAWRFCIAMTGHEVITSTEPVGGAAAW